MIPARRLVPRAALTRHPLPVDDPTIAALTPDERAIAVAVWHGRAESELRAAGTFAYLAEALPAARASPDLIALAHRAVRDEERHAAICWRVAAAFAGGSAPPLRRLPVPRPRHATVDDEVRRVLHVVGMCCLNETTGNAFLERCRAGARGALVVAALHELAIDEVDHARLGWAFLAGPAVPAAARAALAGWLPALVAANLHAWRQRPRHAITSALVAQGCPAWDDVDTAVVAAIDELLVPGFALAGVDTGPIRAWRAAN